MTLFKEVLVPANTSASSRGNTGVRRHQSARRAGGRAPARPGPARAERAPRHGQRLGVHGHARHRRGIRP